MQNAPLGAFCNTFDLHLAIIGLEKQFLVFLKVAVLHRFYCTVTITDHNPCMTQKERATRTQTGTHMLSIVTRVLFLRKMIVKLERTQTTKYADSENFIKGVCVGGGGGLSCQFLFYFLFFVVAHIDIFTF